MADDDVAGGRDGRLHRQHRHQCNTNIGCNHLAQCFHAGGVKINAFMCFGQGANLQGMFPQAMAFFQQQQFLAFQVLHSDAGLSGQRMPARQRQDKGLFEQDFHFEAVVIDRQRQQGGIEFSLA